MRSRLSRGDIAVGILATFGLVSGLVTAPVWGQAPEAASAEAASAEAGPAETPGESAEEAETTSEDSAAPAPPAASAEPGTGGYNVKLQSLERSVSELKEQVFRTKARLQLLKETVLGGVIGASRATVRHRNDMGSSFRLIRVTYALDGVQIYSEADDSGRLSDMGEFDIYNGAIQPGSHTLTVRMVYQGNGFGVFSYLKGYKFNVRSSHTFVASEGKSTAITVVGYEKGGMTTKMADKPAVEFRVDVRVPEGSAQSASKK